MKIYDLPLFYYEESENGVYIFSIYNGYRENERIKLSDIVTFYARGRKIKARIYNIYYFDEYNKYYCKEVGTNDNI